MNNTFWNHIESAVCCLRNDINDGVSYDIETVYMLATLCMFIKTYNPALYEESIENELEGATVKVTRNNRKTNGEWFYVFLKVKNDISGIIDFKNRLEAAGYEIDEDAEDAERMFDDDYGSIHVCLHVFGNVDQIEFLADKVKAVGIFDGQKGLEVVTR